MPKNNPRLSTSWGLAQLTIAVSLVRSGETPLGLTHPPTKIVSVIKNWDFTADNDTLHSRTLVKMMHSFLAISSKEPAAAPQRAPWCHLDWPWSSLVQVWALFSQTQTLTIGFGPADW